MNICSSAANAPTPTSADDKQSCWEARFDEVLHVAADDFRPLRLFAGHWAARGVLSINAVRTRSFFCLPLHSPPPLSHLDEPLQDFISHLVWNSVTAAWSWLSYCCLTFSLPAAFKTPVWDVSGTCGFPQVVKSLLEST